MVDCIVHHVLNTTPSPALADLQGQIRNVDADIEALESERGSFDWSCTNIADVEIRASACKEHERLAQQIRALQTKREQLETERKAMLPSAESPEERLCIAGEGSGIPGVNSGGPLQLTRLDYVGQSDAGFPASFGGHFPFC